VDTCGHDNKRMSKQQHAPGFDPHKQLSQDTPLRVLGIAMIVDQRGIGARLVARYPTQPSSSSGYIDANEDLFFTLTQRQMAKLFRTKKTLCGQPMTLTVNGTYFCGRAILMEGDETVEDTSTAATGETENNLVVFSVIVALASPVHTSSIPFSGWFEGATEDQLDLERYFLSTSTSQTGDGSKKPTMVRASASFLSIRRVHLSLARFCRVLEREERRCQYVSIQVTQLFKIRNELQKKWEEQKVSRSSTSNKQSSSNATNVGSVMSAKSKKGRHSRNNSFSTTLHSDGDDNLIKSTAVSSVQEDQEMEQEILELMLAAPPPENDQGIQQHHGNLVRELVQVFHSLSRNDHEYPPTPAALLSARDGVVYVNQHAVPIEAVSHNRAQKVTGPVVRPYYTLLFPHASPSELLQAFQTSGSAAPQRLQQLLLTVNPQKSLRDIAIDANLPLYTTMEIASYLVTHGACVTSPVVSRSSRLACLHIQGIPDLAFSQTFSNVNLFRLVSFLTSTKTLGEAMSTLTNLDSDDGAWLRQLLPSSLAVPSAGSLLLSEALAPSAVEHSPSGNVSPQQQRWVEELEEHLYAMAIWLLSHRVLSHIQEYLVVVESENDITPTTTNSNELDENLFRELLESDFLNGNVSIPALCWRLALDPQKLRSWGLRHTRIRVVSRIPAPGDDWEEPNA
jgi:hypothetical protein